MTKGGTEREGYSRERGQTSTGGGHPLPFVGGGCVRRSPAVVEGRLCLWAPVVRGWGVAVVVRG
jgi:hypothetical protein